MKDRQGCLEMGSNPCPREDPAAELIFWICETFLSRLCSLVDYWKCCFTGDKGNVKFHRDMEREHATNEQLDHE